MLGGWSSIIDPIQLADKGARISGELPIKGLARLVKMCRDDDGSVQIDLQFERGPVGGLRIVHGAIAARVKLTCQRCMDGMAITLKSRPRLLLLRPGESDELMESDSALLVERPVPLGTLIEDELLLAMPMIPMHPIEGCSAKESIQRSGHRKSDRSENKRLNPFSVLTTLKHSDR